MESFATILIPDTTRALAYKDAYGLAVLILILLIRPQGLFGKKGAACVSGLSHLQKGIIGLVILAAVLPLRSDCATIGSIP